MIRSYQDGGTPNTVWYLEQTFRAQPRPAKALGVPVEIVRAELPSPELSRFLYTGVGGDLFWVDRLPWTWQRWYDWLSQPGVETWVAWVRGTPAGYAELHAQPAGQVELTYFGLLPSFTGQGLGGHLLTFILDHAWTIAHRWPDQEPTTRVWLHTCALDSPIALPTYQSHGLRLYRTRTETVDLPAEPAGPWPGARRAVRHLIESESESTEEAQLTISPATVGCTQIPMSRRNVRRAGDGGLPSQAGGSVKGDAMGKSGTSAT